MVPPLQDEERNVSSSEKLTAEPPRTDANATGKMLRRSSRTAARERRIAATDAIADFT
jgi:hypothetical protein